MPSTQKAVNYTDEQVERMVEVYTSAETDQERAEAVETLIAETGKNKRSIVAKLSREGVYITPTKTTKSGKAVVSKAQLVEQLAVKLGVEAQSIASLVKATKADLENALS